MNGKIRKCFLMLSLAASLSAAVFSTAASAQGVQVDIKGTVVDSYGLSKENPPSEPSATSMANSRSKCLKAAAFPYPA